MKNPLTTVQRIVMNIVIRDWLKEEAYNRTFDDYIRMAHRMPKLEACYQFVTDRLHEMATTNTQWFDAICPFQAGDKHIYYKPFPTSVSRETVRLALKNWGVNLLKEMPLPEPC